MKIKLWLYIMNLGDGSCAVKFFSSKENAENFASKDDERFCDDIYYKEIDIDSATGYVLTDPTR